MVFRRVSCVSCWKIEEIETVYTDYIKKCVCSKNWVWITDMGVENPRSVFSDLKDQLNCE